MPNDALREAATGTKVVSPSSNLAAFLEKHKKQIELALPKHLNADRMCRLAMTAFSQNASLQGCDLKSIFGAVITSGQMGLEIGVAGQGYLVPYKGKAQFIPGWQGLVDLVARSGRGTVWTGAVFVGDEFEWAMGDRPFVRHKPCGEDDAAKLTHVYAIGRVTGGDWPVIDVWPIAKIRKHRDRFNKVGAKHYSFENFEMYARKVPLLQVIKYMPKSIELTNALEVDEAAEPGKFATLDGISVRVEDPDGGADNGAGKDIDKDTGEIKSGAGNAVPKPQAPDINDAIKLIKAGKYEEARDLARQLGGKVPDDIEAMIKNRDAMKKAKNNPGMAVD